MTGAEWESGIALALAAREKLRRAHNDMGHSVVNGAGRLRPERAAQWRDYRAGQFVPASRRIEGDICQLRDNVPAETLAESGQIVQDGQLVFPPGADWQKRMALLEAASILWGPLDPESSVVLLVRAQEELEPPQELLDEADISPAGAKAKARPDPTEDYTTYSKADPNNRFSVTSTTITVTGLTRQEDAWVCKDLGAGFFGATFEHDVDHKSTGSSGTYPCVFPWAVSNVLDDAQYWYDHYSQAADVFDWLRTALYIRNEETRASNSQAITAGTQYYLTITRNNAGATLTLYVYSDAARTSLVGSKSVSLTATRTYRYIFAVNSSNAGVSGSISAVIANLDIGAWTVTVVEGLGLTDSAAKGAGKAVAEALGLSDALAKEIGKDIEEAVALLDSAIKATGITISEALGLLDEAAKGVAKPLVEALGLSDSASGQIVFAIVGLVKAVCAAALYRAQNQAEKRASDGTTLRQATNQTERRARDLSRRRATPII